MWITLGVIAWYILGLMGATIVVCITDINSLCNEIRSIAAIAILGPFTFLGVIIFAFVIFVCPIIDKYTFVPLEKWCRRV